MPKFDFDLDDLFKSAVQEAKQRNAVKAQATLDSKAEKLARPKLTPGFYEETNWQLSRVVSLIHQPSNTLLGNFKEMLYVGAKVLSITDLIPKKLIRVTIPTESQVVEFVTGDWWLSRETEQHQDSRRWVESRSAIIGISLHECGLFCDAAEVTVRLEHGWIARVELVEDTRFYNLTRTQFLILPKGVDVLEGMSFDCKIALKSELHVGEDKDEN